MFHRNMRLKFLLFILLVFSRILFSAEVKLRSENVFLCDLLEDNPDYILIQFKNQKYKIPRSEIISVSPDVSGSHRSYKDSSVTLDDKKVVTGELTEETNEMITIRVGKDELAIPKNTILEFKKPEKNSPVSLDTYKVNEKEKSDSNWTIGLHLSGFKNGREVGLTSYATYGGGFFIEPGFAKINDRFLFGIQSEFFSSSGSITYNFFQNFLYLHFNHIVFGQNIYYKIGVGTSYISIIESSQTVKLFRPAANGEIGWQKVFSDKYLLRVGIRENGIFEMPKTWDMFGLQVSFGYKF